MKVSVEHPPPAPPPEDTVVLVLSMQEARLLTAVCGSMGQSGDTLEVHVPIFKGALSRNSLNSSDAQAVCGQIYAFLVAVVNWR